MVYFQLSWSQYIGEIDVVDNTKPGETTKIRTGDVIHFEEGTANVSTAAGTGKAKCKLEIIWFVSLATFYWIDNCATVIGVSYVPAHLHPEDLIVEKH